MARGLSPALFLSILSATGSYAFNFGQVSLSNRSHGRTRHGRCRRQLDMMTSSLDRAAIFIDEDRLRDDGVGGAERARLAESLALEFRVRTAAMEAACETQLAKQRAAHKLEMAQQRVLLLEVCTVVVTASCLGGLETGWIGHAENGRVLLSFGVYSLLFCRRNVTDWCGGCCGCAPRCKDRRATWSNRGR